MPAGGRWAACRIDEANHEHRVGLNDVGEDLPRPDRRQVVDIAHDQHGALQGTALSSACTRKTSTIEVSSTTSRSQSSGLSSP